MMKIVCECCGRQIVTSWCDDKYTAPSKGAVRSIGNGAICGDCASSLDDNGLFPEEFEQANFMSLKRG